MVFDEIFSTFLVNSEIRKKIKRIKKKKIFNIKEQDKIIDKLDFSLTNGQIKALNEINSDLNSSTKMFRPITGRCREW